MRELKDIRLELDGIDREMVALFERRMVLSQEVAQVKMAQGMDVLDASREKQVLDSRAAMLDDAHWAGDVRTLYETIMAMSRAEQQRMLKEAGHA